jgi:2-keto-4-pentenoate hydratase
VAVALHADGQMLDQGHGGAAMGDPLLALAWLAGFLAPRGLAVPAGSIVLTGGLTRAHAALPGQRFRAEFAGLGQVDAEFV